MVPLNLLMCAGRTNDFVVVVRKGNKKKEIQKKKKIEGWEKRERKKVGEGGGEEGWMYGREVW